MLGIRELSTFQASNAAMENIQNGRSKPRPYVIPILPWNIYSSMPALLTATMNG